MRGQDQPTLSQALHLINGETTTGKIAEGKVVEKLLAETGKRPTSGRPFTCVFVAAADPGRGRTDRGAARRPPPTASRLSKTCSGPS